MAEYRNVVGTVSFVGEVREVGDTRVRNVGVRLANSPDNTQFTLGFWGESADVEVAQGDFIHAEGAYKLGKEYKGERPHEISVYRYTVTTPTKANQDNDTKKSSAPVKGQRKVTY